VELIWRRGTKALQRGRFLALRVRPAGVTPRRLARAAGGELAVRWLLAEWPVGKPEPTKYWLSSLPETTPLVELVRLARLRWRVEQDYRELKGALGLDHFEGRGWVGWHHHVTLVGRARLSDPGTAAPPKTGVGLSLWQLLGELQVLLACWAGACPLCKRPAPR
jgi:SRSO17 transposase